MSINLTKNKSIRIIALFVVFCGISFSFVQKNIAQQVVDVPKKIEKDGKLKGGNFYKGLAQKKYGKPVLQKAAKSGATGNELCSTVNHTINQPENFGSGFNWCKDDKELLLVAFINAADNLGVSITGVKQGDTITVTSAAGIASFSEDKGNPLVSSFIGVAAKIGQVLAPEFAPVIGAAEELAKDQFKATGVKTKRRDASGVDPGTDHKARQEGGLVISLPTQGGPIYSGNDDTKSRWITANETRSDSYRPAHANYSFFYVQGNPTHNTRQAVTDGEIYVLPWDWSFDDNAGYYKVFIHLKRGTIAPETQDRRPSRNVNR